MMSMSQKLILCDVTDLALLSHSLPSAVGGRHLIQKCSESSMLDKPEKTRQLLTTLGAALPFEVELTPSLIAHLQAQRVAANVKQRQIVSKISYLGDDGGIVCHTVPEEERDVIIVSLTHVLINHEQGARLALQNDHLRYAITWSSLAVALIVLYYLYHCHNPGPE
jgi:cytochrome oxidase assembly protein ShyY1